MMISQKNIPTGYLRKVHHIAFNVQNMAASRHFYGHILGLHELTGDEIPETLIELVNTGKVANFATPDGTIIDLFGEPELLPPDPDPSNLADVAGANSIFIHF
jgi:glyoxylase I family protein